MTDVQEVPAHTIFAKESVPIHPNVGLLLQGVSAAAVGSGALIPSLPSWTEAALGAARDPVLAALVTYDTKRLEPVGASWGAEP